MKAKKSEVTDITSFMTMEVRMILFSTSSQVPKLFNNLLPNRYMAERIKALSYHQEDPGSIPGSAN